MNNETSTICLVDTKGIDVLIWQIGAFIFPILGIPGHIITIIVMLCSQRRCSQATSLYFISISITEIIYLSFMFWDWLYAINLVSDPRQILNCAFFYPFVSGMGLISLVLVVHLNLDRISIINKPQPSYFNSIYKRISIKILITYLIILFYIFHYYFSLYYDSKSFVIFGQSCRVYKYAHLWFYWIWPYIHLIARLTPCLILICCTIYIFLNRYTNQKTILHRQQQAFSLVLVLSSIYTFLAVIPISILQIFNKYMWKYEMECFCLDCRIMNGYAEQWKLLNVICILWEASIYMIKFYIKIIFSLEFRCDVKKFIFYRSKIDINNISVERTNSKKLNK